MEKPKSKKAVVIMLVVVLVAILSPVIIINIQRHSDKVYVCTGRYAKAYHRNTYCEGLDNCSGDIICIDKKEAIEDGKHPCGYCYGKRNK